MRQFNYNYVSNLINSYCFQRIGLFYFSKSRIRRKLNGLELFIFLNIFWVFNILFEKFSKYHFEVFVSNNFNSSFTLVHTDTNKPEVIYSFPPNNIKEIKVKSLFKFQILNSLVPNKSIIFDIPLSNVYYLNDFVVKIEKNCVITIKPKISLRNIFLVSLASIFQQNSDDIQFFLALIKFFKKRFVIQLSGLDFLPNWLNQKILLFSNSNVNSLGIKHSDPPSAVLIDSNGLIFNDQYFFIKDLSNNPKSGFIAGNHCRVSYNYYQNKISFLDNCDAKDISHIEGGIYLAGKYDANWFHFLIETVPRLLMLPNNIVRRDLPLIVSNLVPQQGIDLLKLLWKGEIIIIKNISFVNDIFVPPHHTILLDDSRSPSLKFECNFNADILIKYRYLVHQIFEISSKSNLSLKLCLLKKSGNRWLNIEDYCAQNHGPEVKNVYPENLSLQNQVRLYKECSDLIGEGGVLSNMLFLPKGSNIFTGVKSNQLTRTWFSSLAEIFELNYFEIPEINGLEKGQNGGRLSSYVT